MRRSAQLDGLAATPPQPAGQDTPASPTERFAQDGLSSVALALGLIYALLAPAHLWIVEGDARFVLAACASASALVGFGLALRWRRRPKGPRRFHVRLAGLFGILLANSVVHMALEPAPEQTTNFALIAIVTGLLCASPSWLAGMLGLNLVCWAALAWFAPAAPAWVHFSFFFLMANVAAVTFHLFRVRGLRRLELSNAEIERAHAELRKSEWNLRLAQKIAHLGSYEFDGSDASPVVWSEETFRIFGMDPKQDPPTLGDYVKRVVHPDDRERFESAVVRFRNGDLPEGFVYRIVRPDGAIRYVETRGNTVELAGGPPHWIGTILDVTDRELTDQALHRQEQELSHAVRLGTMGEMAAVLAHELHQPLGAIVNYARGCSRRLESEGGLEPPALREALDEICGQAERSSDILRTLFDFARKGEPKREWVKLDAVCQDVLRLVDFDARRDDIHVHVEPSEPESWVQADSIQLAQVLLNLVRNGLDAIREGSGPQRELSIEWRPLEGEMIEVRVTDTGCGIRPEAVDQLFEPFTTTKPAGLGLGLSISRRIVESHGGRIQAAPNAGGGTHFVFTLPGRVGEIPHVD